MISGAEMKLNIDPILVAALREDMPAGDVTTESIMRGPQAGQADLICKQDGVIAGLPVFCRVFQLLDDSAAFATDLEDGQAVVKGQLIGVLSGDIRSILSGERTALNFLQRLSGIASMTASMVAELAGSQTKLLDTRKTTPNLRALEKYAVLMGGGHNHRINLSDGVLIKDNHIAAAGGIKQAVALARRHAPFVRKIEVEVENLEMTVEALAAGADIIMLDNMSDELIAEAVRMINSAAEIECSGNMNRGRLRKLADLRVDYISMGALTHSAPSLDFSLKNLRQA
ncbi:MAG: carboxylating nicotinate-nucleotide diphosphorylase [Clostridia bacterium]|nr:carboxylating nicotinate-nucleotide diphosphorylase [Clostridia bacterium]